MRTNPKSGARKNVSRKSASMDPPVPLIGTTGSKAKKTPESTVVSSETIPSDTVPSTEDIAKLAYALWEARGGNGGSAEEDWFRAEQEIRMRS